MIVEFPLNSVNCIVCDKEIKLRKDFKRNFQMYATSFFTSGHYGSSIIDNINPDDEELEIVICDKCLVEKRKSLYRCNPKIEGYFTADPSYTNYARDLLPIYPLIKDGFIKDDFFILDRGTGNVLNLSKPDLKKVRNSLMYSNQIEKERNEKLSWKRYVVISKGTVLTYFENYEDRENE